jgi:hypothetical protein
MLPYSSSGVKDDTRMYTVDWVGTISFGVLQDGKPRFAFAVEEGQGVPADFNVGDELLIENRMADPASVALGTACGYCEVKHISSATTIKIVHRVYEYIYR